MASFWGEILPVSSRAVADDDDDDEEEEEGSDCNRVSIRDCDMIWNPELRDSSSTVDCRLLIIADGQAAASFVDAALLWEKKSEVVGVLNSGFVQVKKTVESGRKRT